MKICAKCHVKKLVVDFSRSKASNDGLCAKCKACSSEDSRAWYIANREKIIERTRDWKKENPDKDKIHRAKYRSENKERRASYDMAWSIANPEKKRAYTAKYRAANPEKIKAYCVANPEKMKAKKAKYRAAHLSEHRIYEHNRNARKRANGGTLSIGLAEKLYTLQRGKCACGCKQPLGDDYHLDHRMPLALGGTNTDDNIQLLRNVCNMQKHAKHPIDFMQSRGFLL